MAGGERNGRRAQAVFISVTSLGASRCCDLLNVARRRSAEAPAAPRIPAPALPSRAALELGHDFRAAWRVCRATGIKSSHNSHRRPASPLPPLGP